MGQFGRVGYVELSCSDLQQLDYVGFSIEPQFVVGYGLDFAEKYRNIPEVQVLSD